MFFVATMTGILINFQTNIRGGWGRGGGRQPVLLQFAAARFVFFPPARRSTRPGNQSRTFNKNCCLVVFYFVVWP